MSIEQDKINQLDSDYRALLVEKNRLQSELEQARKERDVAQSELAVCCEDRDARALERDEAENRVDEQWLEAISKHWVELTGKLWETLDGETREEGVMANIGALFQQFDDCNPKELSKLKAQNQELASHVRSDAGRIPKLEACCAAMRNRLEELLEVHEFIDDDEMHRTRLTQAALADTCGQGWASPEAHAALEAEVGQ